MYRYSPLAACKYGHGEQSFGFMQFDALEICFIVPLLEFLTEEPSSVGPTTLTTLCIFSPIISLPALELSAKVN